MTKSELKTGMIVVLRNGKECIVFRDAATRYNDQNCLVATDGADYWHQLSNYNEDLTFKSNIECEHKFDIMEVITVFHPYAYIRPDYQKSSRVTIWQRKEKKKYTYAQLREILGEEFEVVG